MFDNLFAKSNERKYFDSISGRDAVSDDTFHRNHYAKSEITLDTCARVRRVLCEQLRMCNTLPHDNVATVFGDIDIGEVCFEIGDEFGLTFSRTDIQHIDGTVDSLIRMTQRQL